MAGRQGGGGFVCACDRLCDKLLQLFRLDPKLQVEFSSWNLYPPTNRKAVLPPELAHIKVTDEQLKNTVKLDWAKVVTHKAEYLKRWNEEVLG